MLKIYTDGAFSSSRNQGGWAFVVTWDNKLAYKEFYPERNTTNNRMEIIAAYEAIAWAKRNKIKVIELFTDSMYVIGTMTKGYQRNANHDLWEIMDKIVDKMNIKWTHVKGHSGDKFNELCDALAVTASHAK